MTTNSASDPDVTVKLDVIPTKVVNKSRDLLQAIGQGDELGSVRDVGCVLTLNFIYICAVAMAVPILPSVYASTPLAAGDMIKGGSLFALGSFINAAGELLSASLLGAMSDRWGRKPFLMIAAIGQVVDLGTAALAASGSEHSALLPHGHLWLFAARGIAGLCGNAGIFSRAYIGDVSDRRTGARNFAALIAMVGIAFIIGLPIGAILSRWGLRLPLLVSTGMNMLAIAITVLLREPRQREKGPTSEKITIKDINPFGALLFLFSSRFLICFAVMSFMDSFTLTMLQTIFFVYIEVVYNAGKIIPVVLIMVVGFGQCLVYGLVLRPLVKRFGEVPAVRAGYAITCSCFAVLAILSYMPNLLWPMFFAMGLLALGLMSNPAEIAIASRCVGPDSQGKLQAANGVLEVVAKILGSLLVFIVWEPTARANHPGAIWWLSSAIMVPGVAIAINIRKFLPLGFQEAHETHTCKPAEAEEGLSTDGGRADMMSDQVRVDSSTSEDREVLDSGFVGDLDEMSQPAGQIKVVSASPPITKESACWSWIGLCASYIALVAIEKNHGERKHFF